MFIHIKRLLSLEYYDYLPTMRNSKYEEKLVVFSPITGNKPISGAFSSFNLFNNNREESREFGGGPSTTIHCSEMKRLRRVNFYLINPHSSSKKDLKRIKAAKKYLAQISKNCASTHCPRIETYERRLKLIMARELMDIHA